MRRRPSTRTAAGTQAKLDIYENATYTKIPGGEGVYNSEHSWPNSYGFNDQEPVSEYPDCHHLFASDTGHNSNRGTQPFGSCTSGCVENDALEPRLRRRHRLVPGELELGRRLRLRGPEPPVERPRPRPALPGLRYEGSTHPFTGATERNLVLTDKVALIQSGQPYMGFHPGLLQRHLEGPADAATVSLNVTVADATAPGSLTVVDHQATGTVNLIIDVNGYYR